MRPELEVLAKSQNCIKATHARVDTEAQCLVSTVCCVWWAKAAEGGPSAAAPNCEGSSRL